MITLYIIIGLIVHILLGFITHYLMYLKCKKALDPIQIRYFIHEKYDILHKDDIDPRSRDLHGVVVICNGSISILIYIISQLYWTVFKSMQYWYVKYINKQYYVQWKHYCIKNNKAYNKSLTSRYSRIVKDEIRNDPALSDLIGYNSDFDIDWKTLINFDDNDNIYFNGKRCNADQLYQHCQTVIQRFNSHMPIKSFDDL